MKTTRVVGWVLLLGLAGLPGFGETLWQDDFATARRYERWGDPCWTLGQGQAAFRAPAGESFLVAIMPQLRTLTISADLTATGRTGSTWTVAGLALFNDPNNHWRLLLVEGPDGRKYFELIEKLNGEHQAQNGITIPADPPSTLPSERNIPLNAANTVKPLGMAHSTPASMLPPYCVSGSP